jgi:hypothetical protein
VVRPPTRRLPCRHTLASLARRQVRLGPSLGFLKYGEVAVESTAVNEPSILLALTMRRRTGLVVVTCLFFVLTAALLLSRQGASSRCHLSLRILSFTNGPAAGKLATFCLVNDGDRTAQVLPVYAFESQPMKLDASMMGSVQGGLRMLRPGEAWTNTIPLPSLDDRPWRLSFQYFKKRNPASAFGHYWLMQAGLAKREEEGSNASTDWVTGSPGSHSDGPANRSQPIRPETNRMSLAAGPRR